MTATSTKLVSLTSKWFIRPGREAAVIPALERLADAVREGEPDTLAYLVHTPLGVAALQSRPPSEPGTVLFVEVYASPEAFDRHVKGPIFTDFVREHGSCFVAANGSPFTFVEFLERRAGFIRTAAIPPLREAAHENRHPAVMFEILAKSQQPLLDFYQRVFGWRYEVGTGGFAYVPFPVETMPLLGGIGQANEKQKGFEAGRNFYLLVDDLPATIEAVKAAGGSAYVDPTKIDSYELAMVKDPEGNVVGLMKPFRAGPSR
jgi:predicted enzyme related to lactoylglutathione lyase/quinol monooxygenase YgiN